MRDVPQMHIDVEFHQQQVDQPPYVGSIAGIGQDRLYFIMTSNLSKEGITLAAAIGSAIGVSTKAVSSSVQAVAKNGFDVQGPDGIELDEGLRQRLVEVLCVPVTIAVCLLRGTGNHNIRIPLLLNEEQHIFGEDGTALEQYLKEINDL